MRATGKVLPALAAIPAVVTVCLACLYLAPKPIVRLDNLVYDTWMRLADKPHPLDVPAIVEIDDKSLEKLGQWPWPRYVLAELAEKILAAGAAAIGLDILLAEPDRTSAVFLRKSLEERSGRPLDLGNIPPEYLDNDASFARAIKDRPVVLGAFGLFTGEKPAGPLPPSAAVVEMTPPGAPNPRDAIKKAGGLLAPLPLFSNAAPVGIINADVHDDGVIRSVPLLVRAGDNVYAALSLRTLMAALGRGTLLLSSDMGGLASLGIGDIGVPLGPDGSFRPFYNGPARTYPYYSAADVLDGKTGKKELEGRIVFVGASAAGLLDIRSTPLDPVTPGVEVHATLIDNMLSGRSVSIPAWAPALQILAVAISACLSLAIFGLLPAAAYAALSAALLAAWLLGSWLLFSRGIFITPVYAVMATVLMGLLIVPVRFWREQKAKMQIKGAFAHYVAPEVVNRIAANGTRALAGESREVSVLFTDVRGFTTISEKMEPERLVRLLNSYFTPMTACVIANEGTLDKFIGDALMAFWNAPLDVEEHQKKAVLAALEMQKKLAGLRPEFLREFGAEIKIGAGIHCGVVQVGNMGSDDLLNYTCIGDNVNLASRLEGLCKRYGAGIIASSAIVSGCGGMAFRRLDRIRVKGSSRPLEIFTPIGRENGPGADIEKQWKDALDAYFNGEFAKAAGLFEKLLPIAGMETAAALFHDRCRTLMAHPPEKWDGVWTYDTK